MKKSSTQQQRKAVLFARVSTKDQEEQGHSLPAQTEKLRAYASKNGMTIIKEFVFQETGGSKKQRKKFNEMIDYLKRHDDGNVPILLTTNVDRITRNFKDAVEIDELRIHKGLHVHFIQDGFTISPQSTGNDMFMWEAKVFMGKQYLNRIREDAVRSREYKIKNGEWTHRAPVGYLHSKDQNGRSTVILDPDRAPLVRRLFVEYAKGGISVSELSRMATNWGLRNPTKAQGKISKSQAHRMIQNPFYYGVIIDGDDVITHQYPPLIDKATWDQCQRVREGYHKKPFAYAAKPFAFRGLVTCSHCGSAYTTEQKKGKYNYLFCTKNKDKNCPAVRVKETDLLDQVACVLDSISIPPDVLDVAKEHLAKTHDAKNEYHNAAVKNIEKALSSVDRQIQRLFDLYLKAEDSSSITTNELDKKMSELKQEQHDLRHQLSTHQSADDDFYVSLNLMLELVQNASDLFRAGNIEQKRKLLNLLCWNLQIKHGKLEIALRSPFDLFMNRTDRNEWQWLQ
tara:strand:+ start:2963 stop:4495 length:1533 start_codon:yes stop_codon:yes gene_type:complete